MQPSPNGQRSASALSLSRPAQASLALRPARSLSRPRRPFHEAPAPPVTLSKPLVRPPDINLTALGDPPRVIRAFGAHGQTRDFAPIESAARKSICACVGTGKAEERSDHKTCAKFRGLRKLHSQIVNTPATPTVGRRCFGLDTIISAQQGKDQTDDHDHH